MAYFKPSYGVNGLGIPMGPMDAATLHHSMGYATGEKELLILKDREKTTYRTLHVRHATHQALPQYTHMRWTRPPPTHKLVVRLPCWSLGPCWR